MDVFQAAKTNLQQQMQNQQINIRGTEKRIWILHLQSGDNIMDVEYSSETQRNTAADNIENSISGVKIFLVDRVDNIRSYP